MLELRPVATLKGPYQQKLGIPRQSGLTHARAELHFDAARFGPESLRGLEAVSHVWLIWGFSQHFGRPTKDTVRPPRLGGEARLGVFATRSSFRPNPLGLSLVRVESVAFPRLVVTGADLLDGTPIYDVKPYLPWAEAPPEASCAWAPAPPPRLPFRISDAARPAFEALGPHLQSAIRESLALDPRPAWDRDPPRRWSTRMAGHELSFTVDGQGLCLESIEPVAADL